MQIHDELVQPEAGTLAHCGKLGGLKMGEAQRGQGLIFIRKAGEVADDPHQLVPNQLQRLLHQDDVRVVAHIAACGAQVDNGHGLGALVAPCVDMSHHVMAQLPLVLRCSGEVHVVNIGLHLVNLLLCDGKTQLHLRTGKGNPQPAPCGEFFYRGENILHLVAGIAAGKGTFIPVVHRGNLTSHGISP